VFQEEMQDEYSSKQDLGSSESDLDLGMYPPPDAADEDSSMDSLGKYLVNQHLWVLIEDYPIIVTFSEQNTLIKLNWNCFFSSPHLSVLNWVPPIPPVERPHIES
jgi:hypothetical protein